MPHVTLTEPPLLSRARLQRDDHLIADPLRLAERWTSARVVVMDDAGSFHVRDGALDLRTADEIAAEPPEHACYLGASDDGTNYWVVRASKVPLSWADDSVKSDLRGVGGLLTELEAAMVATALAVTNWHRSIERLGPMESASAKGGWVRVDQTSGRELFPRTDPAVICLIHDGADRVLLARQGSWPRRRFSLVAGFVEAGESLEQCVAREIHEEVGLDVLEIEYVASQPWPFPRSLMVGFSVVADPEQPIVFHDGEIVEAHWFTREQVRGALASGDLASDDAPLLLPPSISISRTIVEAWV